MKLGKIPVSLFTLSLLVILTGRAQDRSAAIISMAKTPQNVAQLRGMNLDFLMERDDRIYIHAQPDDLLKLQRHGLAYSFEANTDAAASKSDIQAASGGINGAFHSYQELERDLSDLAAGYPEIAELVSLGQSLEARQIYALKISDNVHLEENEPETVFLGCHHAREWISVEVPFLLGKSLVEGYESDPEIKRRVDQSVIWIVPLVNPDGLEYSIHFYRYWRKNRRDNGDGTYGVDLNRNYEFFWGLDEIGSSSSTYSDVYRGPFPFSEPETEIVRSFLSTRPVRSLISYHSYSQVILYPWGYTSQPSDQNNLLHSLARTMSELMQEVNGRFYSYGQAGDALYLTNGDTVDWAFGALGVPAFTIELPPIDVLHGGFFNAEDEIRPIFNENLPAALYLIDWSILNFPRQDIRSGEGPGQIPSSPSRRNSRRIGRSEIRR